MGRGIGAEKPDFRMWGMNGRWERGKVRDGRKRSREKNRENGDCGPNLFGPPRIFCVCYCHIKRGAFYISTFRGFLESQSSVHTWLQLASPGPGVTMRGDWRPLGFHLPMTVCPSDLGRRLWVPGVFTSWQWREAARWKRGGCGLGQLVGV